MPNKFLENGDYKAHFSEIAKVSSSVVIAAFALVFSLKAYTAEDINPEKKRLIDTLLEQQGNQPLQWENSFQASLFSK